MNAYEQTAYGLLIAVSITAAATPAAAFDRSGRADSVRACAAAARETQRVNLSSGVYTERAAVNTPLYIDVPTGMDERHYEACLERAGLSPRETVTAEFERVAACNEQAQRKVVLRQGNGRAAATIASELDPGAYADCVASDIAVEAEIPLRVE